MTPAVGVGLEVNDQHLIRALHDEPVDTAGDGDRARPCACRWRGTAPRRGSPARRGAASAGRVRIERALASQRRVAAGASGSSAGSALGRNGVPVQRIELAQMLQQRVERDAVLARGFGIARIAEALGVGVETRVGSASSANARDGRTIGQRIVRRQRRQSERRRRRPVSRSRSARAAVAARRARADRSAPVSVAVGVGDDLGSSGEACSMASYQLPSRFARLGERSR